MTIGDRVSGGFVKSKPDDIPKRLLEPIGRLLRTGDPAATVDRLFVSQHVSDLRLIIAFALTTVISIFGIGVLLSIINVSIAHRDWSVLHVDSSALGSFLTFFTPVLGVFGAVLAWAYQAGSARLGIVDLFACEIGTLCRVAAVVDSARRWVEVFQHGSPRRDPAANSESPARRFTSEENYFPVFESNTRDLQTLEARVVVNITAFYTYMKAVRDSVRALMDMPSSPAEPQPQTGPSSTSTPWHEAARNVIYMMFLGMESARYAIADLVEFEPDEAERTIVILLSELEAYRFLRDQFADVQDIRYQRLALRDAVYREVVPRLFRDVESGRASMPPQWEPAWRLLPELKRRYDAALNRSLPPRSSAATA